MDKVVTMIRLLILLLCAVLFLAGALWNLCIQPEQTVETIVTEPIQEQQTIENRMAMLRMERDAAWQQLCHTVESLNIADKEQTLQQYAQLQYLEQKLELLLVAKGIEHALVVLSDNQANILVPAEVLHKEYEKLFDLILRNTDYEETEIILVPIE